jgi:hypothetical protein
MPVQAGICWLFYTTSIGLFLTYLCDEYNLNLVIEKFRQFGVFKHLATLETVTLFLVIKFTARTRETWILLRNIWQHWRGTVFQDWGFFVILKCAAGHNVFNYGLFHKITGLNCIVKKMLGFISKSPNIFLVLWNYVCKYWQHCARLVKIAQNLM